MNITDELQEVQTKNGTYCRGTRRKVSNSRIVLTRWMWCLKRHDMGLTSEQIRDGTHSAQIFTEQERH
jgi:hypothetical protein